MIRCAPVAGKSTLNRLELSRPQASRYHKVSHDPQAIDASFVTVFLEAHRMTPNQITLDLEATDDRLHARSGALPRPSRGYCHLPLDASCGQHPLCAELRRSTVRD